MSERDDESSPYFGDNNEYFDRGQALAEMLHAEVLFCNGRKYLAGETVEDETVVLFVNCNDIFMWGCADGESLPLASVQELYEMWKKDPTWGAAVWCIKQRDEMPQKPVERGIRDGGVWDLDSFGLRPNVVATRLKAQKAKP